MLILTLMERGLVSPETPQILRILQTQRGSIYQALDWFSRQLGIVSEMQRAETYPAFSVALQLCREGCSKALDRKLRELYPLCMASTRDFLLEHFEDLG